MSYDDRVMILRSSCGLERAERWKKNLYHVQGYDWKRYRAVPLLGYLPECRW